LVVLFVIGTAGCGKSTLTRAFSEFLESRRARVARVNLDPAAEFLPYEPDVDVRDYVSARELMETYNLGPNGAIIAAVDLMLDYAQLISEEIKDLDPDYAIVDTPGQMELFAFRKSGELVASTLCDRECAVLYVVDGVLAQMPSTFLSSVFLAEAVAYRLRRTQINVLNKVDLLGEGEVDRILEWVDDPEKLLDDLVMETKGVERERNQSLYVALRDFLSYLDLIPVSAKTMEGLERVYALVQQIVMGGEEVGE